MFSAFQNPAPPSDAEIANQALTEESSYRFLSFSANDAVTLGLSIRKRFRASSRHAKGKGLVISIQTIAGHTLFSCTVGDLGHPSGTADVSMSSWTCLEGMIDLVKQTGHSSYYVEKSMAAIGKTPKQMGIVGDYPICGGAFPIWLANAPCTPIAVAACYSGSSTDDHHLVVSTLRDYLKKLSRASDPPVPPPPILETNLVPMPVPPTEAARPTDAPIPPMWQSDTALSLVHDHDHEFHGESLEYQDGQQYGQMAQFGQTHEELHD